MKTEDLIVQLAARSGPVTPLASSAVRVARWLLVSAAAIGLVVLIAGARADLVQAIARPAVAASALSLLVAALMSSWIALRIAVPGGTVPALAETLRVAAFVGSALAMGSSLSFDGMLAAFAREPRHWVCALNVTIGALVPAWAIVVMVSRAAPLQPWRNAALASMAAFALGALGAQIICPIDRGAHLLLWHFVPMQLLSLVAMAVAAPWLAQRMSIAPGRR